MVSMPGFVIQPYLRQIPYVQSYQNYTPGNRSQPQMGTTLHNKANATIILPITLQRQTAMETAFSSQYHKQIYKIYISPSCIQFCLTSAYNICKTKTFEFSFLCEILQRSQKVIFRFRDFASICWFLAFRIL